MFRCEGMICSNKFLFLLKLQYFFVISNVRFSTFIRHMWNFWIDALFSTHMMYVNINISWNSRIISLFLYVVTKCILDFLTIKSLDLKLTLNALIQYKQNWLYAFTMAYDIARLINSFLGLAAIHTKGYKENSAHFGKQNS